MRELEADMVNSARQKSEVPARKHVDGHISRPETPIETNEPSKLIFWPRRFQPYRLWKQPTENE
jgi:hypothetical protein